MKILLRLILIAALSACVSSGPSPAAPPAPISELPALRFPEEIGGEFDVSTTANSGGSAAIKAFVMEGDDISSFIADAALNASFFSTLLDDILKSLHELVIPSREDVTNFEDVIVVAGKLVHVKIDFGAYPNRLGVACSGHTAKVPICYRMWFNGKRAFAGVFLNTIPTDLNSGDGFIQGFSPVTIIGAPFVTAMNYDLRDPNFHTAEFFAGVKEVKSPPFEEIPEQENEFTATIHLAMRQEGPPSSALKLINASSRDYENGSLDHEERNIARWREGEDLWSGTRDLTPLDDFSGFGEFFAACARISSGLVVNSSFCEASGIHVGPVEFLDFFEIGDVLFPSDFPLTPTF
ncbi:MAG: hypothetical protein U1F66_03625 [bacterium]